MGTWLFGGYRSEVDDSAPPLFAHGGQYSFGAENCTVQVGVHAAAPIFIGQFLEQGLYGASDVVDEDMHGTPFFKHGVRKASHVVPVGHVAGDGEDITSGLSPYFFSDLGQAVCPTS